MGGSRLVYSSDGGGVEYCPDCERPKAQCRCASRQRQPAAPPGRHVPDDGVVRVFRDRSGRRGKTVTLVTGVRADPESLRLWRPRSSGSAGREGASKRERSRSRATTERRSPPSCAS